MFAFTLIVVMVFSKHNKKIYERMEQLPLEEDDIIEEEVKK